MSDATSDPNIVITRPSRRRTGTVWAVILLIVVLAAGGYAWYASRPQPVVVVRRDIQGHVPLTGEIVTAPDGRADVYAPFQAPVQRIEASVGQRVRRGDVLVELQAPSGTAYLDQAAANLRAAQHAYDTAYRQYTSAVEQAQTHAPQAVPLTAQNRETGLALYRQQLDAARQAYADARSREHQGWVRSPITGTVLALNALPGQTAGRDPKTPLATVVNLNDLQIAAPLTNEQAAYVKPDMPVSITFAQGAEPLRGHVSRITTQTEEKVGGLVKDSRYVALIDFGNRDGTAKPGMKPQLALLTGDAKDAVAVPSDAVQVDGEGHATVKVRRGGAWQTVAVATGVSDGRYTQVKSGLQPGETVAVTPGVIRAASLPKL